LENEVIAEENNCIRLERRRTTLSVLELIGEGGGGDRYGFWSENNGKKQTKNR
jgi:hypothetical protein